VSDLFPATLAEMARAAAREVALRRRVYPRWVAEGRMKAHHAERQIARHLRRTAAQGEGGMTVDETRFMPQNAEPADAETSTGPKTCELPQARLRMESRCWSHFQHASGLNARGMPSMSQNDNATVRRSPSGWHDYGSAHDAGHDEMQLDVYRFYEKLVGEQIGAGKLLYVVAEAPIVDDKSGRLIAFADIGLRVEAPAGQPRWHMLELKPRIYTCGGLIRQCKALVQIIERLSDIHHRVTAVVYDDDPKLAMLKELYSDVYPFNRAKRRIVA